MVLLTMSGVVHIDPAAITFPEDFDALLDTCTTVNAQNVRTWAMDKVVVSGVRRVSAIDVEDFLSLCIQLKETGDAPNPPKFLTLAMETRGEGGSGAEVEARQQRALCQSLVEYLWRCADHGGLQIGGGFLVLPSTGNAEEGAAGPNVHEKAKYTSAPQLYSFSCCAYAPYRSLNLTTHICHTDVLYRQRNYRGI